jgi:DNA-binding CsgD family transcriptional regulator/ribosomal protein L14
MISSVAEDRLLDGIYAAALEPERWISVLDQLRSDFDADGAMLARLDVTDGDGEILALNDDPKVHSAYHDYYHAINPLARVDDVRGYTASWKAEVLIDEDYFDRETLVASEYYQDFLRPNSANWGLSIRLGLQGSQRTNIDIGRRSGRFEETAIVAARRLQPHLIRASLITKRLSGLQALELYDQLDNTRAAMMLVDAGGALIHANSVGEAMLKDGNVLSVASGCVVASTMVKTAELLTAVIGATSTRISRRVGTSIVLADDNGGVTTTLTVAPVGPDKISAFARPLALLTLEVPKRRNLVDQARVAERLGLTRAEARLAVWLAQGGTLAGAADMFAISINTVRTQLASIFGKTSINRQTELVRLVLSLV